MQVNISKVKTEIIQWIRDWYRENGGSDTYNMKIVIGMSGGKDSTICAKLCALAIGEENVIGIGMPSNGQGYNNIEEICQNIGIRCIKNPIGRIINAIEDSTKLEEKDIELSEQAKQNIPPRIRTAVLYAYAQTINGRVCCTDNASENYLGYSTFGGDDLGAFSPLGNLTVTEVRELGLAIGLPKEWVMKIPDDGLPYSSSDEEKFGFSYTTLDKYIRMIEIPKDKIREKIDNMHIKSQFKRDIIRVPAYEPKLWP